MKPEEAKKLLFDRPQITISKALECLRCICLTNVDELNERLQYIHDSIPKLITGSDNLDQLKVNSLTEQALLKEQIQIEKRLSETSRNYLIGRSIESDNRDDMGKNPNPQMSIAIIQELARNQVQRIEIQDRETEELDYIQKKFITSIRNILKKYEHVDLNTILQDKFGSADLELLCNVKLIDLIPVIKNQLEHHEREIDNEVIKMRNSKTEVQERAKESMEKELKTHNETMDELKGHVIILRSTQQIIDDNEVARKSNLRRITNRGEHYQRMLIGKIEGKKEELEAKAAQTTTEMQQPDVEPLTERERGRNS